MKLHLVFLALLTFLVPGDVTAQKVSDDLAASYACNLAKVKDHMKQGNYVRVKSGPGTQFRTSDKLRSGKNIYICDEQGAWFKISYGDLGNPCGKFVKNGINVQEAKDCRSGWVEKKWIQVISG